MERIAGCVAIVAMLAFTSVLLAGCGEKTVPAGGPAVEKAPAEKAAPEKKEGEAPAKTAEGVIEQKTCPVMGGAISKDVFVDYKDRRIYFCCPMCPPKFKEDPEKYVKIVDEEIAKLKAEKK